MQMEILMNVFCILRHFLNWYKKPRDYWPKASQWLCLNFYWCDKYSALTLHHEALQPNHVKPEIGNSLMYQVPSHNIWHEHWNVPWFFSKYHSTQTVPTTAQARQNFKHLLGLEMSYKELFSRIHTKGMIYNPFCTF